MRTQLLAGAMSLAVFAGVLAGQEPVVPAPGKDSVDEKLKPALDRVQRMTVRIPTETDPRIATLKPTPLIRYSDQERALTESTLWMWHEGEVPVLFCKVERIPATDSERWQFCCVPAAASKLDVEWNGDYRWRSTDVDFRWTPLVHDAEPGSRAAGRLGQLKSLSRQFSADIENLTVQDREEMRLLSQPLYRYAASSQNVLDGAVFGLTSNGTNPDTLLLIEALKDPQSDSRWRYAVVGMSGDAINVYHSQKTVWSKPFTKGPGDHGSWLWYLGK